MSNIHQAVDRRVLDTATAVKESPREAPVAGLIVVAFATAVVIIILQRAGLPANLDEAAVLAIGITAISSIRLAYLLSRRSDAIPLIVFHTFVMVWFGLATLAQLSFEQVPLKYDFAGMPWNSSLVLVIVGICAYETGWAIGGRRSRRNRSMKQKRVDVDPARLLAATWFGLCVTVGAILFMGGPRTFLATRQTYVIQVYGVGGSKASGAILNAIVLIVPFVLSLSWIFLARTRGISSFGHRLAYGCCLLVTLYVSNPVVQTRFWVVTIYTSLAVAAFSKNLPRTIRRLIPLSLLAILIVFPFSDIFRYSSSAVSGRTFSISDPIRELSTKGDFDVSAQLAQTVRYRQTVGGRDGRQLIGDVGFFVPRSVWQGKPVDSGTLVAIQYELGNTNVSEPLWAEGYIDFGILGIVVYLTMFGWLARRISRLNAQSSLLAPLSLVFALFQVIVLRGSLLQIMGVSVLLWVLMRILLLRKCHDAIRSAAR